MAIAPALHQASRRPRAARRVAPLLSALLALACTDAAPPGGGQLVRSEVFYSPSFRVNRILRSMKGPQRYADIQLGDPTTPELLWITGYRTEVVDSESLQPVSAEFMCHNNLDLVGDDERLRSVRSGVQPRLFTLSQGQMGVEFPEGFGIPVLSTGTYRLWTQVLNLNPIQEPVEIRYRTTVEYISSADVETPLQPLYQQAVSGLKPVAAESGHGHLHANHASHPPGEHDASCAVEEPEPRFTAHWVVEPGREEVETRVTEALALQEDTTVHHIAVHLHPFARSLELRDLTTGETVFKSSADNRPEKIGLSNVESYSSAEGLPLHKDHDYALISVYDNDSGVEQDAMAVMFLYLLDKSFAWPPEGRVF